MAFNFSCLGRASPLLNGAPAKVEGASALSLAVPVTLGFSALAPIS
ncbi:hypothetical protein [Acidilobus sp.]